MTNDPLDFEFDSPETARRFLGVLRYDVPVQVRVLIDPETAAPPADPEPEPEPTTTDEPTPADDGAEPEPDPEPSTLPSGVILADSGMGADPEPEPDPEPAPEPVDAGARWDDADIIDRRVWPGGDRHLGEIEPTSFDHEFLTWLADAGRVIMDDIEATFEARYPDADPHTAVHRLSKRRLVDRDRVRPGATADEERDPREWLYVYYISEHGRAELNRIGEYDPRMYNREPVDESYNPTAGTGAHEALAWIAELDDGDGVRTAEVESHVTVIKPQSVSPALSYHAGAGLVEWRYDRSSFSGGARGPRRYRLTEAGAAMLDDFGPFPWDEADEGEAGADAGAGDNGDGGGGGDNDDDGGRYDGLHQIAERAQERSEESDA